MQTLVLRLSRLRAKLIYMSILTLFILTCPNLSIRLDHTHTYTLSTNTPTGATNPSYMIGPKQIRRILEHNRLKNCKILEKVRIDHRNLDTKIKELDIPKCAHLQQELKQLKAQKLRLKDQIRRLMKEVLTSEPQTITSLGQGGFGKVLYGHCANTGKDVAIKLAAITDSMPLWKEYLVLQRLNEHGFPKVHYYGKQEIHDIGLKIVMVMDILGPSIEKLWFTTTLGVQGFSAITVLKLATELMTRLQSLSRFDIVHGDIQPGNFLMGAFDNRTVHLIDFGLCSLPKLDVIGGETSNRPFRGALEQKSQTIVIRESNGSACDLVRGTLAFSSASVLLGERTEERDDLESLAYSLAYLRTGSLPWGQLELKMNTDATGYQEDNSAVSNNEMADSCRGLVAHVAAMKKSCSFADLFGSHMKDCPAAQFIMVMLEHARSLNGGAKPDYASLQARLHEAYAHCKSGEDKLTGGAAALAESSGLSVGGSKLNEELQDPVSSNAWTRHEAVLKSLLHQEVFDWEKDGIFWSAKDGALIHSGYN